jgi:hypothetical protein
MEVTIVDADIEVGAHWIIDLGQQLLGKLTIAVTELIHVCISPPK